MDFLTLKRIVDQITYKDWDIWTVSKGGENFVYVSFFADGEIQKSRKWVISKYATKSEVVQTVLKCILTAEEHETREAFRYKGAKIFGPHFDVDQLAAFAKKKDNLDTRTENVALGLN